MPYGTLSPCQVNSLFGLLLVTVMGRCVTCFLTEGYFPLGAIFRAERHFLLFKDQLAESGRQKTRKYHYARKIPPGGKRP